MKLSVDQLRSSMLVRRHNVVALAFVLCAWLIAAAHLHLADKEQGGIGTDTRNCSYCLASATGAAPLPDYRVPEVFTASIAAAVSHDLPADEQVAPTFYLSRGPPAL